MAVVMRHVVFDCTNQIRHAPKGSSTDPLARDLREPPLDQVKPRGTRRNEVAVIPGMGGEPGVDLRMAVCPVVVENQMPGAASGQRPVEFVQEGQDLDVAFPWRTPGEDGPIEDVEGREQIGRSHTNTAHANLMQALPNCVKVGFTGTPTIMRAKGQTARIFGDFIDRYTIRESEADGATVPILYESRTTGAAVEGGGKLDEVFEDMLVDRTPEELEVIKKKYATKGHVMEATALIAAKARNMLRHYVENILPNGFKAQVVAVSRHRARAGGRRAHADRRSGRCIGRLSSAGTAEPQALGALQELPVSGEELDHAQTDYRQGGAPPR